MNRAALIQQIREYTTPYQEEITFKTKFIDLLAHPNCFERDHLPGHITGSTLIIDQTRQFTLLTHHAKLNKWLQPGGHADGDENILSVALREAQEETGLKELTCVSTVIFDIDIHTIPNRKDIPEHLHYDVRFLLMASTDNMLIVSKESHDLAWVKIEQLSTITNNHSILRMAEKVQRLSGAYQ